MMPQIYLGNSCIFLRAPEPNDAQYIYDCENYTENWHSGKISSPISMATIEQHIENSANDIFTTKQFRFIIVQKGNKKIVGIADIYDYDPLHMRAAVGIIIFPEENKKQGFASQTLILLKKYCFDFLRLHQIYCEIADNNKASIALFTKANFLKSGTKKNWINTVNGFIDVSYYQCFEN